MQVSLLLVAVVHDLMNVVRWFKVAIKDYRYSRLVYSTSVDHGLPKINSSYPIHSFKSFQFSQSDCVIYITLDAILRQLKIQ